MKQTAENMQLDLHLRNGATESRPAIAFQLASLHRSCNEKWTIVAILNANNNQYGNPEDTANTIPST
jgi:hypothetical protein